MTSREEIVVIDDDEPVRELLASVIEKEGYVCKTFASAPEALRRIADVAPILIIADISMPEMSGIEFMHELRKSHPQTPVIVLTGYADQSTFREALRYRVSDFLAKPFLVETVQQSLRKVLGVDDSFVEQFLETVTHRLREARLALGLKQSEVAARCGMSTSQVSQIELRQSTPSLASLLRLCKALHLSVSQLVEGF